MLKTKNLYPLIFLILVMLISACTKKDSRDLPPTDTGPEVSPTTSGSSDVPNVYRPAAGTIMSWGDGSKMVYVPAGEFLMGSGSDAENAPEHLVALDGFWINQTEVTNRLYKRCINAGVCSLPSSEGIPWFGDLFYADYPVVGVDWEQANAYCTWALGTLPTEAQWEMAAAGPEHNLYPWGDIVPACDLLNFNDCLLPSSPDYTGSYAMGISTFGLFDMGGNVFEWVADFYAPDAYLSGQNNNPGGPASGEMRVVRGGGYNSPEVLVRTSTRGALSQEMFGSNIGFRCLLSEQAAVNNTVAPVCQMSPYLPEPEGSVESDPLHSVPIAILGGYCYIAGGGVSAGINIDAGQPVTDVNDYVVTSVGGQLTCIPTPGFPNRLTCYGPGITDDLTVPVSVCYTGGELPIPPGDPVCDTDYVYNPDSGFCEYSPVSMPDTGCPSGYISAEDGTCLPPAGPGDTCPVGSYPYQTGSVTVCVPAGGTGCTGGVGTCPVTCLPGYTYNPTLGCCTPPQGNLRECPRDTTYSETTQACIPLPPGGGEICITNSVYIPFCATPTPPPPACNTIGDRVTCEAFGCQWWVQTGPPYNNSCRVKP